MIGGSNLEVGLDSVLENPGLDARLLRVRKTVVAVESGDAKATHRLNQKIRLVLRSITDDPKAVPSHRELAADLWQRQKHFDPRRQKDEPEDPAEVEAEESPTSAASATYEPGAWYMFKAPANDESEFTRLTNVERQKLLKVTEPEWLVYLDDLMRTSTTPPCGNYGFTPEGLLAYAHASRGPFTDDGELTYGGNRRADALLCRERLIAGKVAPADRKPDLSKLREYVSPLFWELFVERN